jgi:Protein of unknown function (DUF4087)
MRMKCSVLVALLSLGVSGLPAHAQGAPQKLCGWISNPTPANWWLNDRSGEWLISVQGGYQAQGADLPDFGNNWVKTNGNYGYGCACVTATVDAKDRRIVRIVSARALPLATCRKDPNLKRPR